MSYLIFPSRVNPSIAQARRIAACGWTKRVRDGRPQYFSQNGVQVRCLDHAFMLATRFGGFPPWMELTPRDTWCLVKFRRRRVLL